MIKSRRQETLPDANSHLHKRILRSQTDIGIEHTAEMPAPLVEAGAVLIFFYGCARFVPLIAGPENN